MPDGRLEEAGAREGKVPPRRRTRMAKLVRELLAIQAHPHCVVEGGGHARQIRQPPGRLAVAQPERQPEEELVLKRQRKIRRQGGKLVRAVSRDAAVDDLPEGIQVVALAGLATVPRPLARAFFRRQEIQRARQLGQRAGQRGEQPQVRQLRLAADEQDVLRLDVTVSEARLVQRRDAIQQPFQSGQQLLGRQRAMRKPRGQGVREIAFGLVRGVVGWLHGVVEAGVILADMEDVQQQGIVFGQTAVVRDALQLALPAGADLGLGNHLQGHALPGGVLAIEDLAIRPAAAARQDLQTVKIHRFLRHENA